MTKAKHYINMFCRHIKVKGAADEEVEIVTKSGKIKTVHIAASIITIKGKSLVQGIFRDITERRLIEKKIKESEEKYRTLADNINVGVYRNTPGPEGKFIEANPAIVTMFGLRE